MAFTYDNIFAVDPHNPANIAKNASITIFDPADQAQAPIAIQDPSGSPLPNPITVDAAGMSSAFQHPTLARVGWKGAGFTGYFTSYEGMFNETVAAKDLAQAAVGEAEAAAAERVTAAAVTGGKLILTKATGATVDAGSVIGPKGDKGDPGTKGTDGANVLPTDAAIKAIIEDPTSSARAAMTEVYVGTENLAGVVAKPTAIIFGTSLELQNGSGAYVPNPPNAPAGISSRGWVNWMNVYLGQRFKVVRNAGIGGNRFDQMRARLNTDVLAYPSDWVLIGGPANDIIQSRSTSAIIADLDAIHDALIGAGRRVLQLTAPPAADYTTAGQKATLDAVNAHILSLHQKRGVVAVNSYPVTANVTTYAPRTGMAVDTIHYTEQAAHRIGRQAAAAVASVLPVIPVGISQPMDTKNIVGNGAFTGGTGWTTSAGSGTTTPTYPGGGRAFLTIAGATTASSENTIYYLEPVANGRYAPGDVVQAQAVIRWTALKPLGIASACRPFLRIAQRNIDGTFGAEALAFAAASSDNRIITELPESGEVTVITYPVTLGPNTDRLYLYVGWQGAESVTLDIRDAMISKFVA